LYFKTIILFLYIVRVRHSKREEKLFIFTPKNKDGKYTLPFSFRKTRFVVVVV